jgi:hypothetical protein
MEALSPILYVANWTRIIFVRGVRNVGRLCDNRVNSALRPSLAEARWRSATNRFAVVQWKSDTDQEAKTLIYNYADHSVSTLASLLLEVYDEKLVALRPLPPLWWFDLQPDETLSLQRLQRVEFHLGEALLLLPPGVHEPYAIEAEAPPEFDPNWQFFGGATNEMLHCCAGYMCIGAATKPCHECQHSFCDRCRADHAH